MNNEVTFTANEAMLKLAFDVHYKSVIKKSIIGYVVLGLLLGFVVAATDGFTSFPNTLITIGAIMLWTLLVLLVIILMSRYWWLPRFVRRTFAQQKELHQVATIRWTEAAYEVETASAKIMTPWNEFYQWRRGDGILLLYRSEVLFNFFPTESEEFIAAADAIQSQLVAAGVKEKK
jgi:Zn-dependent protease with chaperone function